jgi:hypothetical protein
MKRLLLAMTASALVLAQTPPPHPPAISAPQSTPAFPAGPAGQLMKEIQERGVYMANVEYLCDVIGPRLTGSERLERAGNWALAKAREYGASNVHAETWDFAYGWIRGRDSARLLSHNGIFLRVDQSAWSESTKGAVQGEVMLLEARTLEELEPLRGKLKGKILLRGNPDAPPQRRGEGRPGERIDFQTMLARAQAIAEFLRAEGALAVLQPSNKKYGLSLAGGSPVKDLARKPLPAATLPQEDYRLLLRLLKRGEPVRLELSLNGRYTDAPVPGRNWVAEIPGTEKPEEVVIVGGHLDSWDLGTGATDNATGSMMALETLRAIKALGLKPKRTIRMVLWEGEEQGLLGSRAYVEAHKNELDRIQAVLVNDMGSGATRGWQLQGREEARAAMARAVAPLNDFGVREISLRMMGGTDHASYDRMGVPAFSAIQEGLDYMSHTHHSQVDTFERVVPEQAIQSAQALAVTAWELANLDERLKHYPPRTAPAPAPAAAR